MPSISRLGTSYRFHRHTAPTADVIVLIHGVGLNHRVWKAQFDHFSARYSVLAYDLLGHGQSPLPPAEASVSDYTRQLLDLLDELEIERAHLIGHSMGALIATGFAQAYPQRTNSLVALNMVYQRNAQQRDQVLARAQRVLDSAKIEGIDLALQRWFPGQDSRSGQDSAIDQIREWLQQNDPVGYGRSYYLFAGSDQAFAGQLQHLGLPALFMTASDDRNSTPAMSRALAKACAKGEVIVVDEEAHMMAYRSPGRINPLIEKFIREQNSVNRRS